MKYNKKKALVSAILTIALCLSVIAGATFALFTSNDEVNIAVTSGKVSLTAFIDRPSLKLSSLGVAQSGKFAVGGTATFVENDNLALTNIVPGDKATFNIDVTNYSTVDVMYKLAWNVNNENLDALVATATVEGATEALTATDWILWSAPADAELGETKTLAVEIELPMDAGNDYQDKTANISFTVEAVQANAVVEEVITEDQLIAATAVGVDTITLANSIALTRALNIPNGKTVTIVLNGNELSGEDLVNNGSLIIIDSLAATLADGEGVASAGIVTSNIVNNGTMTIAGGTIVGDVTNNANATMTVAGGTIEGDLINKDGAEMTIAGGEIKGDMIGSNIIISGEVDQINGKTVVTTATDLVAAMTSGGNFILGNSITLGENTTVVVGKDVEATLDLNGCTLLGVNTNTATHNFMIDVKGGTLTAYNGTIEFTHTGSNMGWNGATTVIDITAGGVLNLDGVTVRNNGGTDMNFGVHMNNWGEVTLNADNCAFLSDYCGVRVFNSGFDMNNVKITNSTLTGGTRAFWVHNYKGDLDSAQHSDAAIDARLNLDIYNNNNTFTVTGTAKSPIRYGFGSTVYFNEAGAIVVSTSAELEAAIRAGKTVIGLGDGNYVIPDVAQGKTLKLVGNGNSVIATQDDGSYEGCDYSLDGSTVVFENVVINTDSTTYTGYARLNATYNNCTINGTYTLYGNSVFNNCTFNVSGDIYNIWTWGAPVAEFNNCTFNTSGKALLLYGNTNTKLVVNNCVFNDDNAYADVNNKAAIEVGSDWSGDVKEIIVTNTTVNGFDITSKGISTGTTVWGNKNSLPQNRLNVVIDGVDVY